MRTKTAVSILSICASAALVASCGRDSSDDDAAGDSGSDLCLSEPYKSMPMCKGALQVRINTCPKVQMSVSPTKIVPGGRAALRAEVLDAERDEVTQLWLSDPDGTLDTTRLPDVTYTCASIGRKTLTLTVDDGLGCVSTQKAELLCIDASSFEQAGSDPLDAPDY
jgi:hypothetical protein